MKFHRYIFPLLLPCLFLLACNNDEGLRNIEAYYFPLENLKDGKIYEYRSVGNPNDPPMYWHYKTVKDSGETYLLGTSYAPDFTPDQSAKEERVENGMLLAEFYTYEADPTGEKQQVKATVETSNVFPFEVKEPAGVLLTSISWQPPGDSSKIIFVRNRQYDSDTSFTFQGKTIPAVKFNVRELVDHEAEGHLELEYSAVEVYAKDVGLVYFSKDINKQWQMAYQLANIYEVEDFEKKFKVKLEQTALR